VASNFGFWTLSPDGRLLTKIEASSLERVELLGEDRLDFTSIDNLKQWLVQEEVGWANAYG
jgi:Domain of unknown function (DUF4351)